MALPGTGEYSISRPTGRCAATGGVITPGGRYVAVLVDRPDEDRLERRDYSLGAWEAGPPSAPGERVIGAWRTVMPEPSARPERFLDDAALCELVEQLEGAGEGRHRALRFVLALILARKRLARIIASGGEGMTLVWTGASGRATDPPEPFEVADPGLDEATIDEVTEELSRLLDDDAGAPGGSE